MEKRLLLAIVLSFFVLFIFNKSSIQKPQETPINSQVVENKRVIENGVVLKDEILSQGENSDEAAAVDIVEAEETIDVLDVDKFELSFSSLGGVLKSVFIKEYEETLPVVNIFNIWEYAEKDFTLIRLGVDEVIYQYEDEAVKITKKYSFESDDYLIYGDINVQNKNGSLKNEDFNIKAFSLDMSNLDEKTVKSKTFIRDRSLFEYVISSNLGVHRKNKAYKFNKKELLSETGLVNWIGFRNRYFCAIVKPMFETSGYLIDPVKRDSLLSLDFEVRNSQFSKGEEKVFSSVIFVGPEKVQLLKSYGYGFEKIKMYYKIGFGLFDAIAKIINKAMQLIHKVVPNWGLTIILVSVLIYFSMYPLTLRSMTSMKRMQSLQPQLNALKEKYKSDPQRMNKEVMLLYKDNKINPLGGCLPMLLQLPVFVGLYQVLWRNVSFKGAKFL